MSRRSFGSIRRTSSGRWQARYVGPDGPRKAPRTFLTKADASVFLAAMEREVHGGTWTDPSLRAVTLSDFSREWLKHRPLAPRTRDLYGDLLRMHILPALGRMPLGRLTPSDVRQWHSEAGEQTGKTRTRQAYSLLRAILNTAVADRVLASNPCQIKGAGQVRAPERPLLSLAQVYALADAIGPPLRPLVLVTFWGHLRLGEVVALHCGDVDLATAKLRVQRQVVRTMAGYLETDPKAASRRTVDLPLPAVVALRDHLEAFGPGLPSALIFTRPDGSPLRDYHVHTAWQRARAAAGLPAAHFHDLRHAGLTLVAQLGASTREVMARGGQSTVHAAMIYQHNAEDRGVVIAGLLSQVAEAAAPAPQPGKTAP